ncbi:monooxygenase family protein [Jatrophihabitans sp. GAS493]|uniref:monooxygenase family protein n=1 Tax=Jatrophihabitans sp. GAS493 TaxID=1907575 RepID=UPI000BB82E13
MSTARSYPGNHPRLLQDRAGTGFWHETYSRSGAMESIYIDMPAIGLAKFAPVQPARGSTFSARRPPSRSQSAAISTSAPERGE